MTAGTNVAMRLTLGQIDQLVDPLDDAAGTTLLEVASDLEELIAERPIEDQLGELRRYMDDRLDELVAAVEPIRYAAEEILRLSAESQEGQVEADDGSEAEQPTRRRRRRIAYAAVTVVSLVTGFGLGDPQAGASVALGLNWLQYMYDHRNDF
jgi:hypothetical protein